MRHWRTNPTGPSSFWLARPVGKSYHQYMIESPKIITMHGASWCPDARRARKFLEEREIPYEWHDIDEESESRDLVKEINNGTVVVPTIVFPDGSILVEPSNAQLEEKLGGA